MASSMPQIMGILNVTDDSFSDGGQYTTVDAAVSAALRMVDEGASIIDVGGESTRPGAEPVGLDEELRRVVPVVTELSRLGVYVSVDTYKPSVARAVLLAGARMINDVTGLRDPEMVSVCAGSDCKVVIMHMQGEPRTMQRDPHYGDVVAEVKSFLVEQAQLLQSDRVILDPGIGFGKTVDHNLALVRNVSQLVRTGYPVLLGVSRKSFLGRILGASGIAPVEDRLEGTLAIHAFAQLNGVACLRTHDVLPAVKLAKTLWAIQGE